MKFILLLLFSTVMPIVAFCQELNCTVEINTDKISGTDKAIFNTLKTAITEYMNNTQWGNAKYLTNEKIECKLFFTISSFDGTTMSGDLQVQSTRPVYNSTYTTTLINFKDTSIEFTYTENCAPGIKKQVKNINSSSIGVFEITCFLNRHMEISIVFNKIASKFSGLSNSLLILFINFFSFFTLFFC